MKKNLLLVAASVAAMAAAGAANSADLSVSLATVPVTVAAGPYAIADVATGTLHGNIAGDVTYASPVPSGNNLLVTLRLTNATFSEAVTIADIDLKDGTGTTITGQQKTISEGGQLGDNYVTFLVAGTATQLVKEIEVAATGIKFAALAVPTFAIETTTEFGTAIEGKYAKFGAANAATLVAYKSLVDIEIEAAEKAILALSQDDIFSKFDVLKSPDASSATAAELGAIKVALNDVYLPALASGTNYNLTTTKVTKSVIQDVNFAYTGANGGTTGVALTPVGPVLTADLFAAPVVYSNDVVATLSGTNAKSNSDYGVTVRVDFNDGYPSYSETGALASIRRDGVTAEVPWIASNVLANANSTKATIRVANKGTVPAAVYAEYVTSVNGGTTLVAKNVPVEIGTVEGGKDLQITSNALTTALGEFGRGNVVITVEANAEDITVNNRVVYSDGRFEETSVYLID